MFFKCRCADNFNQRCTGEYYMKGTWKHYMNLIHLTRPYGLHRVYYQLKDNDVDKMDWIKIIYRNSARLPRI